MHHAVYDLELLTAEQLKYELQARGIYVNQDEDLSWLRHQTEQVFDSPVEFSAILQLDLVYQVSRITDYHADFIDVCSVPEALNQTIRDRMLAQCIHLEWRTHELLLAEPDESQAAILSELKLFFIDLATGLMSMQFSPIAKEVQPSVVVGSPTLKSNIEAPGASKHLFQSQDIQQLPSVDSVAAACNFSPAVCDLSQLPSSLYRMIKDSQIFQDESQETILAFLCFALKFQTLAVISGFTDKEILLLLSNVTSGVLLEFILQSSRSVTTLSQFHYKFVEVFLPERVRVKLISTFYHRPQRLDEPMNVYVQDVKMYATVLDPSASEVDVVKTICSGFNPLTRSRVLFAQEPTTFIQLDAICASAEIVRSADIIRDSNFASDTTSVTPRSQNSIDHTNDSSRPFSSTSRRRPVCQYCHRFGHTEDVCYKRQYHVRQSSLRNPVNKRKVGRPQPKLVNNLVAVANILPTLQLFVAGIQTQALLDSGSCVSLVSGDIFLSRIKDLNLTIFPSDISVCSVDGSVLQPIGYCILYVNIAHYTWKFKFYVMKQCPHPVILGADFMTFSGLCLDFSKAQCHFAFAPSNVLPLVKFENNFVAHINPDSAKDQFDVSHLVPDRQQQMLKLLSAFPEVFTEKLGLTNAIEYEISLHDRSVVRHCPYRQSPPRMLVMKSLIEDMLKEGVIRPSSSSYSSPAFLVDKKDHKHRLVVDFRALNKKINIESVPLPDLHTAHHWFAGARYFTSLDLNQAYYQIPLKESSKRLTAFCTEWNLYEFNRVPFGIAVGSQVLTQLLDKVLGDIKFRYVYHYLDDLVIYSRTWDEHLLHLQEVCSRLRQAGLTVRKTKAKLGTNTLIFLGHIISATGVAIDPDRTQAVQDFPFPKNVRQVSRFLGMANFFSKFIPNFALRAEPLYLLRRKNAKFVWGSSQIFAFNDLKNAICHPPVLCAPDFSREFILQTDASTCAISAVLLQEHDGCRKPIAYASRTLSALERKYSTYELEALAVLFGVTKYRSFLEHVSFLVETDNQALSWCLSNPRKVGRLARWAVKLSAFQFRCQHIRGHENAVADALSRMFAEEPTTPAVDVPLSASETIRPPCVSAPVLPQFPLAFSDITAHQARDADIADIKSRLEKGDHLPLYSMSKGVLFCKSSYDNKPKIVLPAHLHEMIFQYFHESLYGAHLGVFKTRAKIRQLYIWKNMDTFIKEKVRACRTCAISKPALNQQIGLFAAQPPKVPFERIYVDFIGKLPRSTAGMSYALVCIDGFTRFSWVIPLKEATTKLAIKALLSIFSSFGPPQYLVSDNGPQFTSQAFKNFCFGHGIQHVTTSPYYPKSNAVERFNRNLKSALIAYHHNEHSKWDSCLPWLVQAFNSAKNEATGHAPSSLLLAFRPNCPLSNKWQISDLLPDKPDRRLIRHVWDEARRNQLKNRARNQRRHDRTHVPCPFQLGDQVLVKTFPLSSKQKKFAAKLAPKFSGPYVIINIFKGTSLLLRNLATGAIKRAHVSHVKPSHLP